MCKRALFCLKRKLFIPLILSILLGSLLLSACSNSRSVHVATIGLNTDAIKGTVLVRSNDNIWSISKRFRLPLRDIIDINSISPPYKLQVGQRIKLPQPEEYIVRENDTLYSISRIFSVSISDLVHINNMRSPYRLHTGQRLRLPSHRKTRIAKSYYQKRDSSVNYKNHKNKNKRYKTTRPTGKRAVPIEKETTFSKNDNNSYNNARFIWPVRGKIISSFGPKSDGLHNDGINIAVPMGAPIKSVSSGKVVYVGDDLNSFGNLILIKHENGWISAYGHLKSTKVSKGDWVKQGDIIGTAGSSGNVTSPQLHFELRRGSKAINPQKYLI